MAEIFAKKINAELQKLVECAHAKRHLEALTATAEVINTVIQILAPSTQNLRHGDEALENLIPASRFTSSRVEGWFCPHPVYPDERMAVQFFENDFCEIKFYWLSDNPTKARVAGGVMLTPNWEDRSTTRNDSYKVGIDFFLSKDLQKLLMVVSDSGNLRVMEFAERLTYTQVEILGKLRNVFALPTREALHSALWDAMALSSVNKQFYAGIAEHFMRLYQYLVVNQNKTPADAKMFASRLLGRLLFVWFLRKKNVVATPERYFPVAIADDSAYYHHTLEPLFFDTLNTPAEKRTVADKTTPYLNGGLFEAHENDWAHDETLRLPEGFFASLFNHFNRYNFTVDESSPEYEQVAIDPEMLGQIFESLLAEQVETTGESARKAKGAFYTPRKIVSFICRESLRRYLYRHFPNSRTREGIDRLLDLPDFQWEQARNNNKRDLSLDADAERKIVEALDRLTVLDPACGSGAFPMGMLQLLVKIYDRLLPRRDDVYWRKLQIIQNSLYGVDIEPMAVEISRLRAWLSLIVDDTGKIDPLPNLDFHFVCADSLLARKQLSLFGDRRLESELADIRRKYFEEHEDKQALRHEYYHLTTLKATENSSPRNLQPKSFDPFKNSRPAEFFNPKTMFGVKNFDLIIGNPPYVQLQNNGGALAQRYADQNFHVFTRTGDLYCLFFEKGYDLLKPGGCLSFITSNKWLRAGYGEKLRTFLAEHTDPIFLFDFGGYQVFGSATVDTCILLFVKATNRGRTRAVRFEAGDTDLSALVNLRSGPTPGDASETSSPPANPAGGAPVASADDSPGNSAGGNSAGSGGSATSVGSSAPAAERCAFSAFRTGAPWVILTPIEQSIKAKVEATGKPLKDWGISINRGILTGCNEAFIINAEKRDEILGNCQTDDERQRTDALIRPILRGRDIKRYGYEWANLWVINSHNGLKRKLPRIDIDKYPAIKKWLDDGGIAYNGKLYKGFKQIERRTDQGDTPYNLRNCAYLQDFDKPKIVYSEIVRSPQFYLDEGGEFVPEATTFLMTGKYLKYLLSFLNSNIVAYIFKKFYAGGGLGEEGYRYKKKFLENLPIPLPASSADSGQFEGLDDGEIDARVCALYGLTDEERAYVARFRP